MSYIYKIKSEYSFGETYAPMDRVIARLKELKCTAAALTDTTTWGHVPFHKKCVEAGIIPILGIEIKVIFDGAAKTMSFLAKNREGLSELYTFLSNTTEHKVKRGTISALTKSDVLRMSKNIIKFSGDVLDSDFLVQIDADLDLSPSSMVLRSKKLDIRSKTSLCSIEVSDNVFCFEEDVKMYEMVTKRTRKPSPQHIVELKGAIHGSSKAVFGEGDFYHLEAYELGKAPMISCDGDLQLLCEEGMIKRGVHVHESYEKRLSYELDIIKSKNFESYFLIVADLVAYAKKHMLVGPGRGSAAGSLVCYLLGITEVDPIACGLSFERFIDITRSDLPDIDLDFPDSKRSMIFDYMQEKYGKNHVAKMGNINFFKGKSALIHIGKTLHIDITPLKHAITTTLKDALENTEIGRSYAAQHPSLVEYAEIEGHASHTGVHAAGVLISTEPITNFCAINSKGIANIDKYSAEELGLLKIDILGLRTLSILEDLDIDWYNIPLDDKKTYDLLNDQKLMGVFQLEGMAARKICHSIKIENIYDICAINALARPGTLDSGITEMYINRKNSPQNFSLDPLVDQFLSETYGLPIYQEQTLSICREIGGFSWEVTNEFRRGIGKSKGADFIETFFESFYEGAISNGLSIEKVNIIWNLIRQMGSYQMNKAHTYCYALISYWTAYFKANYPLQFLCANLRNEKNEESSLALLREMNVNFVPFCSNNSEKTWCVKDGILYGGLTSLKGVGEAKADRLIQRREGPEGCFPESISLLKSPYEDLFPLRNRYLKYYDNSQLIDLSQVESIPHKQSRKFIVEVVSKTLRDRNEPTLLLKRGGEKEHGDTTFLDLKLKDDYSSIGARIAHWQYEDIGKKFYETVKVGAHILVEAVFLSGIRFAFVQKWKILDE